MVVDPDAQQRSFAETLLERGDWRTEAYATGAEALSAARDEPPHLVILEVRLADISGYEVCQALKQDFDDAVAVIFMSADRTEPSDKVAGLLLGADDYLAKPLAGSELLARVIAVLRRVGTTQPRKITGERRGELTRREHEVLQLLAIGLDQPKIAERLVISPKTVSKHIEHILEKLPARSRAEAVAIAYQRGLHAPSADVIPMHRDL
jgi:DNA-binding NarL/FixJ family response regulator